MMEAIWRTLHLIYRLCYNLSTSILHSFLVSRLSIVPAVFLLGLALARYPLVACGESSSQLVTIFRLV